MKPLAILAFAGLTGAAMAQSRNAFVDLQAINGISLTQNGLILDLLVASNATIVFNNVTYTVNDVFGVFLLSNNGPFTATAGTAPSGWDFWLNNDGGTSGVVGYKTPAPNGVPVPPGGSAQFTLGSLSGTVDQVGFHIRVNEQAPFWGNGNTGFGTVPEPASMLALGGLALAALLRRRTK